MGFEKEFSQTRDLSKQTLDKEILLHNNPLLSRKNVDDVIKIFDNLISDIFTSFIRTKMQNELKPIRKNNSYQKTYFILENNNFKKMSTEHLKVQIV